MATPRKLLFDPSKTVVCHCTSRCVRRRHLFKSSARRQLLFERISALVFIFAIDVLEWAFLSNHFHIVLATHPDLVALWSDREVATRYRTLSPDYVWRRRMKIPRHLPAQPQEIEAALADPALIARWRAELASVSTFHKFLKQRIALLINLDENVTGHCWEGRFKSVVALDDEAVIAHMVYVALNPVRAKLARSLEDYGFASIAKRVKELKERIRGGEFAPEAEAARAKLRSLALLPALPCDPGPEVRQLEQLPSGLANPWFGGKVPAIVEGATLAAFIAEVDAAGRRPRGDKRGFIAESVPPVLLSQPVGAAPSAEADVPATPAFLRATREVATSVEAAMSRGLANVWGNFSGGAEVLARHACQMGRRFIVNIAGRAADGDRRRIAASSSLTSTVHASI